MAILEPWLERLTASVYGIPVWALLLAAIAATIVWDARRAAEARGAVDRWVSRHQYRLVSCRRLWLSGTGLRHMGPRLGPEEHAVNHNHVHVFVVRVADRSLGGISTGRVRVRTAPTGVREEVVVSWDSLNVPDTAAPAGPVWEEPELALLRRVENGECGFRPDDRSDGAAERFDVLVEHLLAMRQRGWVTFRTPVGEMRRPGRTYAAVSDVELTDAGRAVLGRAGRRR